MINPCMSIPESGYTFSCNIPIINVITADRLIYDTSIVRLIGWSVGWLTCEATAKKQYAKRERKPNKYVHIANTIVRSDTRLFHDRWGGPHKHHDREEVENEGKKQTIQIDNTALLSLEKQFGQEPTKKSKFKLLLNGGNFFENRKNERKKKME